MATRLCLRIRRLWRKSLVEERMPATCGNAQWRAAAAPHARPGRRWPRPYRIWAVCNVMHVRVALRSLPALGPSTRA